MAAPIPLLKKAAQIYFAITSLKNQTRAQLRTMLPYTDFVGGYCHSSSVLPKVCPAD